MQASMTNPMYKMNLFTADGTKYQLKDITTDLIVSHEENDLAGKVSITIANIKVGNKSLSSIIKLRNKVFVYANTGSGYKEKFRGIVWERKFDTSGSNKEISLTCYDRLIYTQNCKDNLYRKKGHKTQAVITSLCKKWGIKVRYDYKSINHKQLVFRSDNISDIIITLLDEVKKKTGEDYVVYCDKDVMVISSVGKNTTVYQINKKDNAISESYTETMDDMVTKVKIIKAEKKKKKKKDSESEEETGNYLTVASVKGNTKEYGTLQDIIEKGDDEKLSDVKKEAKSILKEKGSPQKDITVTAVDNPLIKKGDKVYINTGVLKNHYIVKGIEHDATGKVMTLEVKKA